jgi:hypothetical protein
MQLIELDSSQNASPQQVDQMLLKHFEELTEELQGITVL